MSLSDLYTKLTATFDNWLAETANRAPNIVAALVVLVLFWFVAKAARSLTSRTLDKLNSNNKAARNLIATMVRFAVLAAGLVIALNVLSLNKALASVLAGAGVVGIALGFAFQDLAANLVSGVALAFNKDLPFKIGDIVETNGTVGTIHKIQLRTTILESFDGKVIVLPNKDIFQNTLINHSQNRRIRVDLSCGISYGDPLEKVKNVALDAVRDLPFRESNREPELFFTEFGDSSINFVLQLWISYRTQHDYLSARSQMIMKLKDAFDREDIMIPFPIRTLDFGIRGGETLKEVVASAEKIAPRN